MAKSFWTTGLGNVLKGVVDPLAKVGAKLLPGAIGYALAGVDKLIPDATAKKIVAKASEQGVVKASEIEKTVKADAAASGVTMSAQEVAAAVSAISKKVAGITNAPVTVDGASLTTQEHVVKSLKPTNPIIYIALAVGALVLIFMIKKR